MRERARYKPGVPGIVNEVSGRRRGKPNNSVKLDRNRERSFGGPTSESTQLGEGKEGQKRCTSADQVISAMGGRSKE